jgi:hypothetical protein
MGKNQSKKKNVGAKAHYFTMQKVQSQCTDTANSFFPSGSGTAAAGGMGSMIEHIERNINIFSKEGTFSDAGQ